MKRFIRWLKMLLADEWKPLPPPNWNSRRQRAGSDEGLW